MITIALLSIGFACAFVGCVIAGHWLSDVHPETEHHDNVRSAIMLALMLMSAASLVAALVLHGWWVGP